MNDKECLEIVLGAITAELVSARAKFPSPNPTLAALVEEVGELAKAILEEPRANVRAEAVQVAVMAIRMILDGDQTMDQTRREAGLDPLVGHLKRATKAG